MSRRDRIIEWLELASHGVTIVGLVLVILQLQLNRSVTHAQVRHELANTIVQLLSNTANNSQLASVLRRAGAGESLTPDELFQFRLRTNAVLRYWEDVHYQYRAGLYDHVEYERQKAAWKDIVTKTAPFVAYWCEVRPLYSPLFASEVDELLPPHSCESLPGK